MESSALNRVNPSQTWHCAVRLKRWVALLLLVVCTTTPISAIADDVADSRWQPDSAQWHWGRDRQIDLIDTKLDITLDPLVRRVTGTVTLQYSALQPGLKDLFLDAKRLTVTRVTDADGHPYAFDVDDDGVHVIFDSPPDPRDTLSIIITYEGTPEKGLYFVPTVAEDPDKVPMIWSQGEMDENRYWFPCYDYPDDRATSAVSVTTPRPNIVISNGALIHREDHADGTRTFHWRESVPNVNYLIALAVGQFDSLVESTSSGLPVVYYCRKGEGEKLARSFGETPGMVEYFEKAIGVPFPYEKYAQVIVTDFTWGGMENASMTTENERALSSAAARPFDRDRTNGLVAHELAHQWFGDLITMRDWAHTWLNEGFATYFTRLWEEHRWGHDEFLLRMYGTQQGGIGASHGYRRAIVNHRYVDADQMFDGHSYSKAGSVLHMVRGLIGDSLWWTAIKTYATRFRENVVESEDFKRVLEEVSGRDFDGFFHQWFYSGGHPVLKIKTGYERDAHVLRIDIDQKQEIDDVTPMFEMPITFEWVTDGRRESREFHIDDKENTFFVSLAEKPDYVIADPEGWLLTEFDFTPSTSELLAQLSDSTRVLARFRAAQTLGKKERTTAIVASLRRTLQSDPYPEIRRTAAEALGELGGADARDALVAGLGDNDLPTQNTILASLGRFLGDDKVFLRLESFARSNALPQLRGTAVLAAARVDPVRAIPLARWAATQKTEKFTLAVDALEALERTKDPELMEFASRYVRKGNDTRVRIAAAGLIGVLARYDDNDRRRETTARHLEQYLDDLNMNFRRPVMRALGALGSNESIPLLQRVQRQTPQFRERNTANDAIAAIRKRSAKDYPGELLLKIEEVQARNRELEKRIEAIEGKGSAADDD